MGTEVRLVEKLAERVVLLAERAALALLPQCAAGWWWRVLLVAVVRVLRLESEEWSLCM